MKHRALSGTIVMSVGLVCGLFAACAGETIPDVDDELRSGVEAAYSRGEVGGAGGNGPVGSNDDADDDDEGRASAGRGGSATASTGGAAGAGDDDNSGGAAGSAIAAAGAAGAAGSGSVVGGGGDAPACDGFPIIQENCGTGSCHGQGSNLGTFAESEEDFLAIVGEEGVVCAGRGALVDPADPENSVLVLKLTDDPPCGQPMPAGSTRLDPADIECITSWIGSLE